MPQQSGLARFFTPSNASLTLLMVAAAVGLYAYFRWPPGSIELPLSTPVPAVDLSGPRIEVSKFNHRLVALAGEFDDELFAYLVLEFVRSSASSRGIEALLSYSRGPEGLIYRLYLHGSENLLAAYDQFAPLLEAGAIAGLGLRWVHPSVLETYRHQTKWLEEAYDWTSGKTLSQVPQDRLREYVRRWVKFKSATDPRIRGRMDGAPSALSRDEAHSLSSDILTIAEFFDLPLEFFLGIGAMENNFMDVRGDLNHAVWKRRAQKGDVVLKRGKRGVLVQNQAHGVWQITQETLRYVHKLYLADTRDYSHLPEHLIPPRELDVLNVPSLALTTYAGLLFRDLLDHFDGDVALAVGAYNGGRRKPNQKYEARVRVAAEYARRVLERAAILNGEPAAETNFLRPGRS
jgi:hypothetical protein